MSNAEDIAEDLFKKYALDGDYTVLHDYKYLFEKAMNEHTNQTLQELKAKVEKMYNLADQRYGNETMDEKRIEYSTEIDCFKTVIKLIEDMANEQV